MFFHVRNLPKYWHEAPYAARQRAKHAREKADAKHERRTTKLTINQEERVKRLVTARVSRSMTL